MYNQKYKQKNSLKRCIPFQTLLIIKGTEVPKLSYLLIELPKHKQPHKNNHWPNR